MGARVAAGKIQPADELVSLVHNPATNAIPQPAALPNEYTASATGPALISYLLNTE